MTRRPAYRVDTPVAFSRARPVGQLLAPAFTIPGSRTWRVVGAVIDLPLHDDGEGGFQGPALPGLWLASAIW